MLVNPIEDQDHVDRATGYNHYFFTNKMEIQINKLHCHPSQEITDITTHCIHCCLYRVAER